jgi:hypothetical protein
MKWFWWTTARGGFNGRNVVVGMLTCSVVVSPRMDEKREMDVECETNHDQKRKDMQFPFSLLMLAHSMLMD